MFGLSIFSISTIISYIGLFCGLLYWVYRKKFKIGFKAHFVRKSNNVWRVVKTLEFKAHQESIGFKGKAFLIDLKRIVYSIGGWSYIVFDYDSGDILTFDGNFIGVDPTAVDIFVNSSIVTKIFEGLDRFGLENIALVVIVLVCGVLGGFLLGVFTSPIILPSAFPVVTPSPTPTPFVVIP